MKYPIEIPANSFIATYHANHFDEIEPATIVTVGWRNIDTGEVVTIDYKNDVTESVERIMGHIMRQQMEAQQLGPESCVERLREMAEERQ
jgi:hypothetical protein